jgi:hypothetical protein
MIRSAAEWLRRHWLPSLLLVVALFEGFLLYQQSVAHRQTRAQSDQLLETFLKGDTAEVAHGRGGIHIRLQNVRFSWSPQVYIDTRDMAILAVPTGRSGVCNFDNLETFHLTLQQSSVCIRPDVMAGMFNESVFNYPGSKVRDFAVSIENEDGKSLLKLAGKVNVVAWIPFAMYTKLAVDRATNTMVITVDHLKIFGGIPATKILKWGPMHLDKMIALPPNQSLIVRGNTMMVKPFGLFPPPRIDGQLADVKVGTDDITISFAGEPVAAPHSDAKNYVSMSGGICQFGKFRMEDTDVLIVDQDQSNPFRFSVAHYADMIKKSRIDVHELRSITVSMPDY